MKSWRLRKNKIWQWYFCYTVDRKQHLKESGRRTLKLLVYQRRSEEVNGGMDMARLYRSCRSVVHEHNYELVTGPEWLIPAILALV